MDKGYQDVMSHMIRSVEEIVDISESNSTPDKMAYKYLIKQVDRLLRSRALDQQYDAMFEVPAMVLFQPHFDRGFVAVKIARHYRRRGFKCDMDGFTIVLRWGKMDSSDDSSEDSSDENNENNHDRKSEDEEDSDEALPSRKIVIESSSSLVSRVASMKKSPKVVKKS